jgi:hypothetical protein
MTHEMSAREADKHHCTSLAALKANPGRPALSCLQKFDEEGKSGSGEFEGVVDSNGHFDISVKGMTGERKYTIISPKELLTLASRAGRRQRSKDVSAS